MTDPAHEQRRQRLIGIGLMCGAVADFACLDAIAKYLGTHMDTLQVVSVRYASAFLLTLLISNPIVRPGLLRTQKPSLQLGRSLLLLGSTVLQLHGVPLSPARRGAGDPVLDAVHGGDPRRPDAGRMGRLAALDRDRRRLHRRAGGGAAGPGRPAMGGAALVRQRGLLRLLQHHHADAGALRFQPDHLVLFQHAGGGDHAAGPAVRLDPAAVGARRHPDGGAGRCSARSATSC